MKHRILRTASILTLVVACASGGRAQSNQALPVPGIDPARDVPGAKELPDAKTEYKVLFDAAAAPAKPSDVNQMLQTVARYVNTLAKLGVPAEHRKIAVIFHQGSTPAVLRNDAFKARNDGQDNPNVSLIQALAKAGVGFHVCGQALLGQKIDPKDVQPEIQVDLWALTTIINFEQRGYVHIGG